MSKHNSEKSLLSFNSTPSRFSKTQMQNLVFFLLMTITACFLFWKCRYGFSHIDESFYLAIPYRLLKGDSLLQHEWCIAQLSGFLTYPFVWAYVSIVGSTEGIVLGMRYFFTLLQCLTAIFLYIRLKHMHWLGAVVTAISIALYTHNGIMSLSYYSISISSFILSLIIILTSKQHIGLQYVVSGLFFAAAVLCFPYLIAVYALYLVIVCTNSILYAIFIRKRNYTNCIPILTIKGACFFTAGAAVLAVIFAVFVLSRASIPKIIESIPYMIAEPDHSENTISYKTYYILKDIIYANTWTKNIYISFFCLGFIYLLDTKRMHHRFFYTPVVAICTLLLMYSFYRQNNYINHLMWSINILSVALLLLSPNKEKILLFCIFWLPGMLYTYCVSLSSNQGFHAISSASAVPLVGSIMITALFLSEIRPSGNYKFFSSLSCCLLYLILIVQLYMQVDLRYHSVYWEYSMKYQTTYIDRGSCAGLIVSSEKHSLYTDCLDMVQSVEHNLDGKVLYLTMNTFVYLDSNLEVAGYSPWLHNMEDYTFQALDAYYKINPDKMPDIVHVDAEYPYAAEQFCQMFHYNMQSTPYGFLLTPQ